MASVASVAKKCFKVNKLKTKNINEAQKQAQKQAESRRLAWRCRRGMLELDIVLQRFVAQHFADLSVAELGAFDEMLELPDNDFWGLLSSENISNTATMAVVKKLKPCNIR